MTLNSLSMAKMSPPLLPTSTGTVAIQHQSPHSKVIPSSRANSSRNGDGMLPLAMPTATPVLPSGRLMLVDGVSTLEPVWLSKA